MSSERGGGGGCQKKSDACPLFCVGGSKCKKMKQVQKLVLNDALALQSHNFYIVDTFDIVDIVDIGDIVDTIDIRQFQTTPGCN